MAFKPRVLFMGTPEFARIILEALANDGRFEMVGVFAQPDKPVGRGNKLTSPPVAIFAKSKNIPLFQPLKIKDPQALKSLSDLQPDFIVVAAYGKILPDEVLNAAKIECLNVHASLLPRHRGAAPINYALLKNDAETGVAIMRVVRELDAGPVFLEKKISITDNDNAETLTAKLAKLGAQAICESLLALAQHKTNPLEQDHTQATFSPKLTKEMSPLNWNQNARTLFNQVRALVPWPVSETRMDGHRVKIFSTRITDKKSTEVPGTVIKIDKEGWTVATNDFNILVTEVQLEGKKRMSAFDLANGMRLKPGIKLT